MNESTKPEVVIYFLGGAGAFATRYLPETLPPWMDDMKLRALDTSRSELNMFNTVHPIDITIIGGEGSGGVRANKISTLKLEVPKELIKHKPGDINILVFSSSGASGSSLAMIMTKYLLELGKDVICLTSLTSHNIQRSSMAYKQLLALNNISTRVGKSINGTVYDAAKVGYAEVDKAIAKDIIALTFFLSGNVPGVDSADIKSVLSPETIPDISVSPGFQRVRVLVGKAKDETTMANARLVLSDIGGADSIGIDTQVSYSGVITASEYSMFGGEGEPILGLVTDSNHIPRLIEDLAVNIDEMKVRSDTLSTQQKVKLSKHFASEEDDDGFIY